MKRFNVFLSDLAESEDREKRLWGGGETSAAIAEKLEASEAMNTSRENFGVRSHRE